MRRVNLLPLFICTAFRFAWAVPALLRRASVGSLSIPVRRGVPQDPSPRAGIGFGCRIVGIFPRLVSVLPPSVPCIWKHRDSSILYRFLRDPRGLVARVHCDKLYFVEFPCDFIIYGIPCHAVVDVSCRYLHTENKPAFVADCMCLIRKLPFMLSFYEHSAVRVCCGDRLFCCLSAAGILRIVVVIVFLLDRLLPQLFTLCIDLPAKLA